MTLAEMITEIKNMLDRADLSDAQITNFLVAGIRQLERKHNYRHMHVYTDHTLAAGDYAFNNPIPKYKTLITMRIRNSDGYRYSPFKRMDKKDALSFYPDLTNNTGRPYIVSLISEVETEGDLGTDAIPTEQWLIRPTSDDAYTLEIEAYQYSGITENWWYINEWNIALHAALIAAEKYLMNDNRLSVWKMELQEMMDDLTNSQVYESLSGSYLKRGGHKKRNYDIDNG